MKIKIVENFNDMFITTKYIDSSYDDEDLAKFEEKKLNELNWLQYLHRKQLNEKEEREE